MTDKIPAYVTIANELRRSIARGSIRPGTVLLESNLAEVFGASRAPVKQALTLLLKDGVLRRFSGRGLLVGKADPVRTRLTAETLGLNLLAQPIVKSFAWQTFYYQFERELTLQSILGQARINELALARYFEVGRTVAHDLLLNAQKAGLVERLEDSRWWVIPLDEERFDHLYELRLILEPIALISAIGGIPEQTIQKFKARLEKANDRFPNNGQADLDQLEDDLHIGCLRFAENREILLSLRHTRCTLIAGKHIQVALERKPKIDPFMNEHLAILSAVAKQRPREASELLRKHLKSSSVKAQERLHLFRKLPAPTSPAYFL